MNRQIDDVFAFCTAVQAWRANNIFRLHQDFQNNAVARCYSLSSG